MQPPHLVRRQRVGGAQRVEACPPQRLVGVDVADAGDERLVQQQRLEPRRAPAQPLRQLGGGEGRGQRLRPVAAEHVADPVRRLGVRHPLGPTARLRWTAHQPAALPQADAPELAHVAVAQLPSIGQLEHDPRVGIVRRAGRRHDQRAGHAQRHGHDPPIGQVDEHALGAPADAADLRAADLGHELLRLRMADGPLPAHLGIGDLRARDPALQVARDGLDLGQLGHLATRRAARRSPLPPPREPRRPPSWGRAARCRPRGRIGPWSPSRCRP